MCQYIMKRKCFRLCLSFYLSFLLSKYLKSVIFLCAGNGTNGDGKIAQEKITYTWINSKANQCEEKISTEIEHAIEMDDPSNQKLDK